MIHHSKKSAVGRPCKTLEIVVISYQSIDLHKKFVRSNVENTNITVILWLNFLRITRAIGLSSPLPKRHKSMRGANCFSVIVTELTATNAASYKKKN